MTNTCKQLVSVIVPVYNVERYLEECINSILAQTYNNLELILVDDGSTDSSSQICKHFAQIDDRVFFYSQRNAGASVARNTGIDLSRGEWIVFVDSDDILYVDAINTLLEAALKFQVDIVCGKITSNWEEINRVSTRPSFKTYSDACKLIHYSLVENYSFGKLYASNLFKTNDISYPAGRRYEEDTATTYRLFESASSVAVTDIAIYFYRLRDGSITSIPLSDDINDLFKTYREVKEYYTDNHSDSCLMFQATILYDLQRIATISDVSLQKKNDVYKFVKSEFSSEMFNSVIRHLHMPMGKKLFLMKIGFAPFLIRFKHYIKEKKKCNV